MEHTELLQNYMLAMTRFGRLNMPILFKRVSKGEFFLLELLNEHMSDYHEGMNVSAIAERLRVSPPAVSRMLRALFARELVERSVSASDRRNTLIALTEKGDEIRKEQERCIEGFLESVIIQMGRERMGAFIPLWNALTDIMEIKLKMMAGVVRC